MSTSIPAQKQGKPQPPAPPELSHNGRVHGNAMQDATLWEMARRIPGAPGQTFRLAWSVDRPMVVTVLVCQLMSVIGTPVMLTTVPRAMSPLWQRLACGRALYRRPGFLILDEPTSEMDIYSPRSPAGK